MKRLLLLTVILVAAAAVASATPCANTTLGALTATGFSCTSQGVTFSNFSYAGSSISGANVVATLITDDSPGQNGDGWSFAPSGGWGAGSSFTIGFTISVTPHQGVGPIVLTVDQILAGGGASSGNHVNASDAEGGVFPNPLTMVATSPGGETAQSDPYSLNSVVSLTTFSVPVTVPAHGLSSYRQLFYTTVIPEPVTFVLIGSGLIGLTLLRRRLHKG